jgi:hypothetical protein
MGEHDTTIIGWERTHSGNWWPIEELKEGYIYSAAVIACSQCRHMISGMGGPRTYVLCLECFEKADRAK